MTNQPKPDPTEERIAEIEQRITSLQEEGEMLDWGYTIKWLIAELRKARERNVLMMDHYECKMHDKERFSRIEEELREARKQVAKWEHGYATAAAADERYLEIGKLREQVRIARDMHDASRALLDVIAAHEIDSLDCDRRGVTHCACLESAVQAVANTLKQMEKCK